MLKIFVGNFGFNVQDEDLSELFTPYGDVISAEVVTDRFTGTSSGFGFVIMKDEVAGRKAIAALDRIVVDRNVINVREVTKEYV